MKSNYSVKGESCKLRPQRINEVVAVFQPLRTATLAATDTLSRTLTICSLNIRDVYQRVPKSTAFLVLGAVRFSSSSTRLDFRSAGMTDRGIAGIIALVRE